MNASRGQGRLVVTTDGTGIEGRAGAALPSRVADRVGLTAALRAATDGCRGWRDHAPGVVIRDLAVMLADGGTCIDDIETLRRRHPALFGRVASEPTAWRTIEALAGDELVDIRFGFHPLIAWLDRDDGHGEPLGALLRPGNAGANHADDNIDVLEQALARLPAMPAGKPIIVRGDSAMATKRLLGYARDCGVGVSVSLPIGRHRRVQAAIRALHDQPGVWQPAVRQDGRVRDGAHVAELAEVPLGDGWPDGLRVIVRREPLHPGAQQTLDDLDGHRFTAVLTDTTERDIVEIDRYHRARARIEDRIKDAKDSGLANLPCGDFDRNAIWMLTVLIALSLTLWTQLLCLDGDLRLARPATLRYRLWHTAARIVSHGRQTLIRLQADWPWADALAAAFARLDRLLPT